MFGRDQWMVARLDAWRGSGEVVLVAEKGFLGIRTLTFSDMCAMMRVSLKTGVGF